jgi:hypothetical protein
MMHYSAIAAVQKIVKSPLLSPPSCMFIILLFFWLPLVHYSPTATTPLNFVPVRLKIYVGGDSDYFELQIQSIQISQIKFVVYS